MVLINSMVLLWYSYGTKFFISQFKNFAWYASIVWYTDGMDRLYGTQMVCRWYVDGMCRGYGTQMVCRWYTDGMQMVWIPGTIQRKI